MIEIPVLETPRLRLRAHSPNDLMACAAMWADPNVVKYIGGKPFSSHETWLRMLRYGGLWPFLGYGFWAVEEKSTKKFIGEMGFADFKRDLIPSISGIPELGWVLESGSHGKKYSTEGLRAIIDWGDRHLKSKRTVCIIEPGNTPSLRVAEKCAYKKFAETTFKESAILLFERNK